MDRKSAFQFFFSNFLFHTVQAITLSEALKVKETSLFYFFHKRNILVLFKTFGVIQILQID